MNLIDKDALVAEIERRIEHNTEWKDACKTLAVLAANQAIEEDKKILSIINTLDVKEVDLDFQRFAKEMDTVFALPSSKTENTEENPFNWEFAIAKHFYSLGLAQKGERV